MCLIKYILFFKSLLKFDAESYHMPGLAWLCVILTYGGLCHQKQQLIIYTINIPDMEK